ncbi:hypothetical protein Tco_0826355 [Tanacetum coccineum]
MFRSAMGMYRSKEDELAKLSSSIFVTNFSNKFLQGAMDYIKQIGSWVDAFIPDRRSKAGKRFGFVRFIIFDVDHLRNIDQDSKLDDELSNEEIDVDAQKNASKMLDMEGDNSGHKVQDVEQESVTKNNSPLNNHKNNTERSTCSGSVIVNGSPTKEFQFHRGLKQGDPLSPFLFLLIMESLTYPMQIVVDQAYLEYFQGYHGEDEDGKHVRSPHQSVVGYRQEVQKHIQAGTYLMGIHSQKMHNGVDIQFWEDKWRGDNTFQSDFPKMYALETQKNISMLLKLSHDNLLCSFRRAPRAGAEELQYNSTHED